MNIACFITSDSIFRSVQATLGRAGFHCERALADTAFLRMVRRGGYDMLLVEFGNNEADWNGIISWISCRIGENSPVVILSASRNPELAATALDAGADDCWAMPLEPVELTARVNALLRRTTRRLPHRIIELVGFSIDREARTVSYMDQPIELTPREFTMAWLFFSTPGVYISRETIGGAIWGVGSEIAGRTIEQHVYKLRKKLQMGMERGVMLRTAYNQGYRLELCDDPALSVSVQALSGGMAERREQFAK